MAEENQSHAVCALTLNLLLFYCFVIKPLTKGSKIKISLEKCNLLYLMLAILLLHLLFI